MKCLICNQSGHSALYCPTVGYAPTNRTRYSTGANDDMGMTETEILSRILKDTSPLFPITPNVVRVDNKPTLEEAVARQIGELVADFDGRGGEEMPKPPRDLTSYADAHASAVKKCQHFDVNNVQYGRMWHCLDCNQYLDRDAMRRSRGDGMWWSW